MTRLRFPASLLPLVLLAACGGDDPPPAPAPATYASRCGLPDGAAEPYRTMAPTGPHCVGAAEYFVTDAARDETLTEAPDDRRSVQVRVLYPAAAKPASNRLPYAIDEVFAEIKWWPAGLRPQGHAWRDAPFGTDKPAPVLLFSPGLGAPAQAYAGLTEELASHGYVVVAISHPYISGATRLPDGRIARYTDDDNDVEPVEEDAWQEDEGGEEAEEAEKRYFDALIGVTVADEVTVLDWLARQHAAPGGLLSGRLDLNRVGAYGHSFGGATALQVQRTDARVKAAVDIDGTVRGDISQPWTKPLMFLQGELVIKGMKIQDDTVTTLMDNRQGPGERHEMAGTCHGDFGDAHRLVDLYNARHPAAPVALNKLMYCSKDPAELERDVRAKLLDFFRRYVG